MVVIITLTSNDVMTVDNLLQMYNFVVDIARMDTVLLYFSILCVLVPVVPVGLKMGPPGQ